MDFDLIFICKIAVKIRLYRVCRKSLNWLGIVKPPVDGNIKFQEKGSLHNYKCI